MIWRDSVGVGVLGQGLDQSVRVISQQSLSVCNAILMSHNNSETDSCLSLQSRSVLGLIFETEFFFLESYDMQET